MCDMTGFNVCYGENDSAWIEPHFCRTPDCGGGMSYNDACDVVAEHYLELAEQWRDRTHWMAVEYMEEEE